MSKPAGVTGRERRAPRVHRWRSRCECCWLILASCQGGSAEKPPPASAAPAPVVAPAAPLAAPVPVVPAAAAAPLEHAPLQIARQERLDSRLLPASEQSGVCAQLHALLERDDPSLKRFAEVTPNQQGAPMEWSLVRSQQEADERSPDGTAWEVWRLAEREGWRLASLSASSASGGWVSESEHCFRPDGTLAQLTDTRRTFHSGHGLISDTVTRSYAPDGRVLSSKTDARQVQSGERAQPGMYHRPEPVAVTKVSELPFASLLTSAR